jgi:prepilin-type N-terminal cleavage/methylation domain-containing protein
MNMRGRKGLTLIEILVATALMAIVAPLVIMFFMYGLQDFMTGSRFIAQQTDINSAYMTFRQQYEMARQVNLILDANTSGSALNQVKAVELLYDPEGGVLDYDEDYKKFNGLNAYVNANQSKPPYDEVGEDGNLKLIYEEKFHKRYEFKDVSTPDFPNSVEIVVYDVAPGGGPYDGGTVLGNLYLTEDGNQSGMFFNNSEKKLWIRILPKKVNEGLFTSRNITRPVDWYFDYVYKSFVFEYDS